MSLTEPLADTGISGISGTVSRLDWDSTLTRVAVGGEAWVRVGNGREPGEEEGVSDLRATWEMKGESRRPETDLLEDSVSTDLLRSAPDTFSFSPEAGGVLGELGLGDLTGEDTLKNPLSSRLSGTSSSSFSFMYKLIEIF